MFATQAFTGFQARVAEVVLGNNRVAKTVAVKKAAVQRFGLMHVLEAIDLPMRPGCNRVEVFRRKGHVLITQTKEAN